MICQLCTYLFERLEHAENNGLDTVYPLLHAALALHGRTPHPPALIGDAFRFFNPEPIAVEMPLSVILEPHARP